MPITLYVLFVGLFAIHPGPGNDSIILFPDASKPLDAAGLRMPVHSSHDSMEFEPPPLHRIKVGYAGFKKSWISLENPDGLAKLSFPGAQTRQLDSMLSLKNLGFGIDDIDRNCLDVSGGCAPDRAAFRVRIEGGSLIAGDALFSQDETDPAELFSFIGEPVGDLQVGIAEVGTTEDPTVKFLTAGISHGSSAVLLRVELNPAPGEYADGFPVLVNDNLLKVAPRAECPLMEGNTKPKCFFMRIESLPLGFPENIHTAALGEVDSHFAHFYRLFENGLPDQKILLPFLASNTFRLEAKNQIPSSRCPSFLLK